jgi:hypothetical protein
LSEKSEKNRKNADPVGIIGESFGFVGAVSEWVGGMCRDFLRICWQQGEILRCWKGHNTFFPKSLVLDRLTQESAFFCLIFWLRKSFD